MTRLDRFEAKYVPEPTCGCWLWFAGATPLGYGVFWTGERLQPAHRYAYEAYRRPLRSGEILCHRCDTPACVNPDHLFVGTKADNSADMVRKRRHWTVALCGEDSATHKLSDLEVDTIRSLLTLGQLSQIEIAARFGVHKSLISHIKHGRCRAHGTQTRLIGSRYEAA